jgi:hypothetical protein
VIKGCDGERAMGYTSAIAIRVIKMIYPSHQTRIGTADRLLGLVGWINLHRDTRIKSLSLRTGTRTSFISDLSEFDGIFLKHLAGSPALLVYIISFLDEMHAAAYPLDSLSTADWRTPNLGN